MAQMLQTTVRATDSASIQTFCALLSLSLLDVEVSIA